MDEEGVYTVGYFKRWECDVALIRFMNILFFDGITNSIYGNLQKNSILDAKQKTKGGAVWGSGDDSVQHLL